MRRTIPLGRIAGVQLGANWSWLIIFALVTWTLAAVILPNQNPGLSEGTYWALGAIAATLFFASIVLHELGHAVQARRDDVEIEGITLWLFGGVAQFRNLYGSPGAEFRIAIAGPAVTLLIAAVLLAASALPLPEAVDAVTSWLAYINVVLLLFNLLPATPLDGGRILHAALWRVKGDFVRATRAAARVGIAFGWLFVAGGIALVLLTGGFGGVWLALIGWFITAAARGEAQQAVARDALAGLRVRDVMSREPVAVPADASLQAFVDEFAADTRFTTYPVTEGDRPVGLLPFDRVTRIPREEWNKRRVRDAMVPFDELTVLDADRDAADALEELSSTIGADAQRAIVVHDARLVGLVAPADLARAVQLHTGG